MWRITARLTPSKSVYESRCLIEHPPGTHFGKKKNADPYPVFGWATLPPNGIFDLKDGSCGRHRPKEKQTVRRSITTKAAARFSTPLVGGYHSLKRAAALLISNL